MDSLLLLHRGQNSMIISHHHRRRQYYRLLINQLHILFLLLLLLIELPADLRHRICREPFLSSFNVASSDTFELLAGLYLRI
ncbi:unnamed protein product [Linum trigynum]|uniref:Uncharacterized protein n=1 Tax=Linum trigynum TaxID=586398 RepID=A0AAV2EFQ4_9ROSI